MEFVMFLKKYISLYIFLGFSGSYGMQATRMTVAEVQKFKAIVRPYSTAALPMRNYRPLFAPIQSSATIAKPLQRSISLPPTFHAATQIKTTAQAAPIASSSVQTSTAASAPQLSAQSAAKLSQQQAKINQQEAERKQLIDQSLQETKSLSIDELSAQIAPLITSRTNLKAAYDHKTNFAKKPSPSELVQLNIEFERAIDDIDLRLAINEKVFRDKIKRLSIDGLNTLDTTLKKRADHLATLEKLSLDSMRNVSFEKACKHRQAIESYKAEREIIEQRSTLVSKLLSDAARLPQIIPEHLELAHNTIAAALWPQYKIVHKMWDRVIAIQESVEGEASNLRGDVAAARPDRDALQRIYENEVRARVELLQFLDALRKCDSPEYNTTNAKLITAVQNIDGKLAQIISTLETEKNVSSVTLPAMAENMQYESTAQARRNEREHPLDYIPTRVAKAALGNVLTAGATISYGAGKPTETTVFAGPISRTYSSNDAAHDQQLLQAFRDKTEELSAAEAKNEVAPTAQPSSANSTSTPKSQVVNSQAAQESVGTKNTAAIAASGTITLQPASSTADVTTEQIMQSFQAYTEAQRRLSDLKTEWQESASRLTADQEKLLSSIHEPIIMSDQMEMDAARQNAVALSLLDLATTTTMTAIEQVKLGNFDRATNFVEWSNYVADSLKEGVLWGQDALKEFFDLQSMAQNIIETNMEASRLEFNCELIGFKYLSDKYGWLDSSTKQDLQHMVDNFINGEIEKGKIVVPALEKKIKDVFKDGTFKGICRTTGYLGMSLWGGPYLFEKAAVGALGTANQLAKTVLTPMNEVGATLKAEEAAVAMTPEGIGVAVNAAEEIGAGNRAARGLTALEETGNTAKGSNTSKIGQEIEHTATKVKPTARKDGPPLDERLWTPEQRAAAEKSKAVGQRIVQNGEEFENSVQRKFGGCGRFKAKSATNGREFDGAFGDIWYEAKYRTDGNYWKDFTPRSVAFEDFTSDMGRGLEVATYHGKKYQLFTNSPIPQFVQEWLNNRGIKYVELL